MNRFGVVFFGLFAFVITFFFYIEPNKLEVVNYEIADYTMRGLKVAIVGDYHAKPKDYEKLKKFVDTLNSLDPDIILSTGDFIGSDDPEKTMPIETTAQILSMIKNKRNFYTVLGEYDTKGNKDKVKLALARYKLRVLDNQAIKTVVKGMPVYIAGVGDVGSEEADLNRALSGTGNPTIVLTHSPDLFAEIPESINLTVAGHTHGGQINIPGIRALYAAPTKYGEKYLYGYIEDGVFRKRKMIVTGGIGTRMIPARFNRPPEIAIINFT